MASAESSAEAEDCNRLFFEAVNEISVSKFQSIISSYSQIEVLTSLTKSNEKGETPILIAMKGGNVKLIKVLVKCLQTFDRKVTEFKVMSKIAIDQLFHYEIPIVELIDLLFNDLHDFDNISWLDFVAQALSRSTSFLQQDTIIALELIGAWLIMHSTFYASRYHPANPSVLGLYLWREAMFLRYFPAHDEPLVPKIPDVSVPSIASSVVFGSAVEFMSMEELNLLEEDFDRIFYSLDHDVRLTCRKQMQRQALLVIRRVTSQSNSEHPHRLYLESLELFFSECASAYFSNLGSSADLVTNVCLFILEQANCCDPKGLFHKSLDIFIGTMSMMSVFFIKMLEEPLDSPGSRELSFANLLPPTKFFGTIAKFLPELAPLLNEIFSKKFGIKTYENIAVTMHYFVVVMESISPRFISSEKHQLEECYSNYIRNLFPERTATVLHVAFWRGLITFPATIKLKTIKLIIKLGADPNAIDQYGVTPLHILAARENIRMEENVALFQILVDAGTHLDMATDSGDTVLSVLKNNLMQPNESNLIVPPYYKSLLNTVFPLSCYCARVIRRHGIPFDEDRLPLHLQTFVSRHSAKDLPKHDDHADADN